MRRLFWHEMRVRVWAIIGWGLGLSLLPAMYVGIYPEFAAQLAAFQELMELPIYQAMGMSLSNFEAYLASTVTNMVPLILAIYAILNGTGTLAGEEEDGRLELLLALPIPRWQVLTVKAAALCLSLLCILAICSASAALTLQVIKAEVQTAVTPIDIYLALLASWPLVASFAMISMLLGAFAPRRKIASLTATLLVVVSYFGANLAGMSTSMASLQKVFLFYYFDATARGITHGQSAGDSLMLIAVTALAYGLALFFFQRRDITVGAWPWQRRSATHQGDPGQ